MRHPNPDMLLHIAMGDAYALCVEYVKRLEHPQLYEDALKFERYLQHPTHRGLRPGMYSDDTQMSVAVAEVLLQGRPPTAIDFSDMFFDAFKRDPRDGYSRAFQAILEEARDPSHLRQLVRPDSNKNGAAMRAVPIGIIKDPKRVVELASLQATVTHATWGGVNSAAAVALMSHYALHERRGFPNMLQWCIKHLDIFEYFKRPWDGPVNSKKGDLGVGLNTAWAVCTLLQEEKSMMGIMKRIIDWGGDTDSVAAIAWGIAGARYRGEVLPEFLARDLEVTGNLKYGPQFLRDLGSRLMQCEA